MNPVEYLMLISINSSVNIPWTKSGMGDADYLYAFDSIVMPIATEFDPDLVIGKSLSVSSRI